MTLVERMARMLCWKNGMDPNLTLGGDGVNFLWHEYERDATGVIEEFQKWIEQFNNENDTIEDVINKLDEEIYQDRDWEKI